MQYTGQQWQNNLQHLQFLWKIDLLHQPLHRWHQLYHNPCHPVVQMQCKRQHLQQYHTQQVAQMQCKSQQWHKQSKVCLRHTYLHHMNHVHRQYQSQCKHKQAKVCQCQDLK